MRKFIQWLIGLITPDDEYTRQAIQDQREAVYPGCELGLMHCLSQSCGCCEGVPSIAFVEARAKRLRDELGVSA